MILMQETYGQLLYIKLDNVFQRLFNRNSLEKKTQLNLHITLNYSLL